MVAINFIEPAKVEEEVVVEEVKEESPVAEAVVITQAPEFVEVYEDVTLEEKGTLELKVTVIGQPLPRIKWMCGDHELQRTPKVSILKGRQWSANTDHHQRHTEDEWRVQGHCQQQRRAGPTLCYYRCHR
ncbi:hypothetical protein NP493_191g03036 [Ridgeia piscesae]|uniref:Immunoglobulin I-set domain-containing protein n=1 Tax=Ridgeia piscesae TaxID=27915 RepID=A0AAD9P2D6_RIDPI|nr:hypothetical protein NP493_191g03036 [Ridgeia piscesae]